MENTKSRIWHYLPYAGLPVIAAALLILQIGGLNLWLLLRNELAVMLCYFAAIADIRTKRIPNMLILIIVAAWALIMIPKLFLDTDPALQILKDSLLGFSIGGGLFLLIYLISRKGLGGGDVKFMAGAGLFLGFNGVIQAMLVGTILAALTALVLIILKKINRKDTIPLVPFLYLGILATIFLQ